MTFYKIGIIEKIVESTCHPRCNNSSSTMKLFFFIQRFTQGDQVLLQRENRRLRAIS